MKRLGKGTVVFAFAAGFVVACESPPAMEVRATSVPVGDKIEVRFDREMTAGVGGLSLRAPPQYWLVLAPEGSPDDYASERAFVERSARSSKIDAARPGRYELRLHSDYPREPYNVVRRARIEVTPNGRTANR